MNNNPFVLPGFGQSGQLGQNPILASMEMMRQAWEGLASSGGMNPSAMGQMMSVEELDKRIADLRAVENWLRMNLSMLGSTIQGMEVQRATIATLKSFVDASGGGAPFGMGAAGGASPSAAGANTGSTRPQSPLEEVLGIRPAGAPDASSAGARPEASAPAPDAQGERTAGGERESTGERKDKDESKDSAHGTAEPSDGATDQADIVGAAASAAQGWWNALQQQFQTLAAATAASAEGAMSDLAEAGKTATEAAMKNAEATGKAMSASASGKLAAKKAVAKKAAAKGAVKPGAASGAPTKTASRTSAKTSTAKTSSPKAPRASSTDAGKISVAPRKTARKSSRTVARKTAG